MSWLIGVQWESRVPEVCSSALVTKGRLLTGPDGAAADVGPRAARNGGRGGAYRDPEYAFKSLGRWGIKNVVGTARIADGRLYATVEELNGLTDMADKYGMTIDVLNPPFLPSRRVDRERRSAIMLE
jgi:hypothetical protein